MNSVFDLFRKLDSWHHGSIVEFPERIEKCIHFVWALTINSIFDRKDVACVVIGDKMKALERMHRE